MSSRSCVKGSRPIARPAGLALSALIALAGATPATAAESPDPAALPLMLRECFAFALKRSETIAVNAELIKETEGRFLQALSGALPRASFESSDKRQDGSGSSAFTLRDVPERKFTVSQPLFSGFKEFAAMAGTRAERRQRIVEKRRAEQLLFADVAQAFHLLLEHQEDLEALGTTRQALAQRIEELQQRERLGRSRASEVVSAEAQLRRVEAELELVRSRETIARHLLEFLTGLERVAAVVDRDPSLPALEPEAAYLTNADSRSDVRALEEAWRAAEKEVTIAQAKFWPTVSLEGNYYAERAGAAEDVKWDATLKLSVPLFQGGQTVGSVREASSKARQARLRFVERQRIAELDIRDAHEKLRAALARLAALERALRASEESYRLQEEDYRLNLVNNLDVLQELQALQDARRSFIQAKHEAKRLSWQLRVAVGETL